MVFMAVSRMVRYEVQRMRLPSSMTRTRALLPGVIFLFGQNPTMIGLANAADGESNPSPSSTAAPRGTTMSTPATTTQPPQPSAAAPQRRALFEIDPVSEVAIFGVTTGFAVLSELIIGTGELRPQDPVDPALLLPIDRGIANAEDVESSGAVLSDVTAGVAITYAVFDSIRAGLNGQPDGWDTYGLLYAEAAITNVALVNLAKIAFRRPRPAAYFELRETGTVSEDTNTALSFYSGHTALVAGLSATATYLAFTGDSSNWERWLTLLIGTFTTTFTAVQRIRVRAHFPTDVIAGALVGAGVGVLVPHFHRASDDEPGPLSFGLAPKLGAGQLGLAVRGRL